MVRSATIGAGTRSNLARRSTGSRPCWLAVRTTLARACQVAAPVQVRLPPRPCGLRPRGGWPAQHASWWPRHRGREGRRTAARVPGPGDPATGGWVGSGSPRRELDPEALGLGGEHGRIQGPGVAGRPQRQGVLSDAAHRVGGLGLPPAGIGQQLPAVPGGAGDGLGRPARGDVRPRWPSSLAILPAGTPSPLLSQAANATARGPSWAPAAPSASEVCSGWRGCTRWPHERRTCTPATRP
jgi:hypothetical protein